VPHFSPAIETLGVHELVVDVSSVLVRAAGYLEGEGVAGGIPVILNAVEHVAVGCDQTG
jgi:hypothetical protein